MKALCLIIGLILGLYLLNFNTIVISIISGCFLIFLFRKFSKSFALLFIIVFISGVGLSNINISSNSDKHEFFGVISKCSDNYFIFNSNFKKLYIYEKEHQHEIGDFLTIDGYKKPIDIHTLESDFDFQNYLKNLGVKEQLYVKNLKISFMNPIRIRNRQRKFLSSFDQDTRDILALVLFGQRNNSQLIRKIEGLQIINLFSISGIFLNMFCYVIVSFLSLKFKPKVAKGVPLIILVFYLFVTFPRFSVLRIFIYRLLLYINDFCLKKRISKLSVIAITMLFFIIFDFHVVYNASFYIGFSLSIMFVLLNFSLRRKTRIKRKLFVAFLMFLFFAPINLAFNNSLVLFSPFYRLLFMPLCFLISFFGMMSFYSIPFLNIFNGLTYGIKGLVDFCGSFNISINGPSLNSYFLCLYYVSFLYSLLLFETKRYKHYRLILTSVSIFLVFNFIPLDNLITFEVNIIDVGQGDAILVRKGQQSLLIDTGGNIYKDIANDVLIPFLKKKRLYHLNSVITTHDDYDHVGALPSLCANFKVNAIIDDKKLFPYHFSGIEIDNLNIYDDNEKDTNYNSLVLFLKYKDLSFLFMGDAPKEIENKIINDNPNLTCDYIKIGHHGSKTSSSYRFLEQVNPKEAIISCGYKNSYSHPDDEVMNILKRLKIAIRRTDLEGTINYKVFI